VARGTCSCLYRFRSYVARGTRIRVCTVSVAMWHVEYAFVCRFSSCVARGTCVRVCAVSVAVWLVERVFVFVPVSVAMRYMECVFVLLPFKCLCDNRTVFVLCRFNCSLLKGKRINRGAV
jgi:NAD-dependent dihydropyrimidine dehydrogenase PreA subunit